jgi:alpha-glucosidase (family GH31 glycosyl hydrolase)
MIAFPRPGSSRVLSLLFTLQMICISSGVFAAETLSNYESYGREGRSIIFTTSTGQRLRITPYGDYVIRVQVVRQGETFFPDDHYEMVESHNWPGALRIVQRGSSIQITTGSITLELNRSPLRIGFYQVGRPTPVLKESDGPVWEGSRITERFTLDDAEHFTGLGHDYYGRSDSLDLKEQVAERNYGSGHGQQSPLIVPFYVSSKGYGLFLNSTFTNSFNFGKEGRYEFSLDDNGYGGRLDYFFILGPEIAGILDRYTQLTGRPRLPSLAVFGLALSDKSNDETTKDPSDENWWKRKALEHWQAGFPLDHFINDNRWRAGGGKRCESYFDWDRTRFPDPAEFERWIRDQGLMVTIDFNRCIAQRSDGYQPSYNIPDTRGIDFADSTPDFTRQEVREWFWKIFWRKSIDPKLGYPGDALWIDEFDQYGPAPTDMTLGNGRHWAEMRNYWFFLIAKSLVQEGWDRDIGAARRPFVWVRGMTAGAQRYATLWSGDIKPSYDEMKQQIRGMQLAGLSGFPIWGHDAGGFYDGDKKVGPDDNMYRQWSMVFGSFTPFWKPHGPGKSRWPLDRSLDAQRDARTYGRLRYALMPYTYTYAHQASETGVPIARAMVIDDQTNPLAWKHDLQYMWGRELLVAPNPSDGEAVPVWLPEGTWYDMWDDTKYLGDRVMTYTAPIGKLPLFVKAGSIVPMVPPALTTSAIEKDKLVIHVYTGSDSEFRLYNDDGITEHYRLEREFTITPLQFRQAQMSLTIGSDMGTYRSAPPRRSYHLVFHGLSGLMAMAVNGRKLATFKSENDAIIASEGTVWDEAGKLLHVYIRSSSVRQRISVKASSPRLRSRLV